MCARRWTRPRAQMGDRRWLVPALLLIGACGDPATEWSQPNEPGGWVNDMEGLWAIARNGRPAGLGALGYADGYESADSLSGVVLHDESLSQGGANLYCAGHGPHAYLIDMQGEELHSWSLDYGQIPGAPPLLNMHQNSWRRVRLLEDGSLLALYGGRGLVKVDRDSRLLWHRPELIHHDLQILTDGTVLTLSRRERIIPRLNERQAVVDDELLWISPDGQVTNRISILDCILQSKYSRLLTDLRPLSGDVLHINTVEPIGPGAAPPFEPGQVLCCSRDRDWLLAIDPGTQRVSWLLEGDWQGPHDVRLLPSGRLLLFDNLGRDPKVAEPFSRILEVDPTGGKIQWEYRSSPPAQFFSRVCGSSNRLPNGNTLVTETTQGRAFEVTPDGQTVWEYHIPHRAGRNRELVACLFEVERIPERQLAWLTR